MAGMLTGWIRVIVDKAKEVIEASEDFDIPGLTGDVHEESNDNQGLIVSENYDALITQDDNDQESHMVSSGGAGIIDNKQLEYIFFSKSLNVNFFANPQAILGDSFRIYQESIMGQRFQLLQGDSEMSVYMILLSENAVLISKELWNKDIEPLLDYASQLKPITTIRGSEDNTQVKVLGRREVHKSVFEETVRQRTSEMKYTDISEENVETVPISLDSQPLYNTDVTVVDIEEQNPDDIARSNTDAHEEDEASVFFSEKGELIELHGDDAGTFARYEGPDGDTGYSLFTYALLKHYKSKPNPIARDDLQGLYRKAGPQRNLNDYYLVARRNSHVYFEITKRFDKIFANITAFPFNQTKEINERYGHVLSGVMFTYIKSLLEICNATKETELPNTPYCLTIERAPNADESSGYVVLDGVCAWTYIESQYNTTSPI